VGIEPSDVGPGREVEGKPSGSERDRLLAAIIRSLADDEGYAGLTAARVSRFSGLPEASYRRHFPSRTDAFIAAFDVFADRLWREVSIAREAQRDWPSQVRAGIEVALTRLSEASAPARVFAIEAPAVAGLPASERQFAVLDSYAALLREGRDLYPAARGLPALTERVLIGGIASIVFSHLLAEEPETIAALGPELTEVLLAPYLGLEEARRFARA
jgi:AcrR family transcriptional regulator